MIGATAQSLPAIGERHDGRTRIADAEDLALRIRDTPPGPERRKRCEAILANLRAGLNGASNAR